MSSTIDDVVRMVEIIDGYCPRIDHPDEVMEQMITEFEAACRALTRDDVIEVSRRTRSFVGFGRSGTRKAVIMFFTDGWRRRRSLLIEQSLMGPSCVSL